MRGKLGVRGYERDTSEPSQEMLVKISKFFGVTLSYLLGEEDYS